MLIPQVVGFRLHGKLPEGATATDLVLTVTEMLRKKGVVGKFVEFYGAGRGGAAARRPRHHRQHGPRVRRHLRHLPGRRRDAALPALDGPRPTSRSRWSRRTARSRGCSTTPTTPEAVLHRHAASSTWPPSSRASPARSGRRTGCSLCQAQEVVRGRAAASLKPSRRRRRGGPALDGDASIGVAPASAPSPDAEARVGGHRRHHQLHQHVEPVGDGGRGPAGEEGGRAGA